MNRLIKLTPIMHKNNSFIKRGLNDYCTCNWSCLAGSFDEADEGGCRPEQAGGPEAQQGGGPAQEGAAEEGGPHPHPGEQAPPAGHGAQTQTGGGEYTGSPVVVGPTPAGSV